MKTYSEKYSNADKLYQSIVSKELLEKRRSMMDDFSRFRRLSTKRIAEQQAKRIELRGGVDADKAAHDEEIIEQTVQFLVESKKEELPE